MEMTIDECFKWLEYHKQGEVGKAVECIDLAIDTMRKYEKVKDIYYHQSGEALKNSLRAVIEDGKID